jgi:hypothetical protein
MLIEPGKTYVRRFHAAVNAQRRGASAPRLRHALAALDLHPRSLSPHAVVCLRRLRAPMPENFAAGIEDDTARLRTWAAATAGVLETFIRQAARPAEGFVPAGAECVVFNDRAEVLACLAEDWCDGRAHARWWWRTLFAQPDLDAPARLLLRTPEYVPAAFAHLAARRRLVDFAQKLNDAEARALLDGLVTRFALPALAAVLADAGWSEPARTHAGATDERGESGAAKRDARAAPWPDLVPKHQAATLRPARQALLGVGLMLQHAPSRVRTQGFAQAVRDWLGGQDDGQAQAAHVSARSESSSSTGGARSAEVAAAAEPTTNEPARGVAHDGAAQPRVRASDATVADVSSRAATAADEASASTGARANAQETRAADSTQSSVARELLSQPESGQEEQLFGAPERTASDAERRPAAIAVEDDACANEARELSELAPAESEPDLRAGASVEQFVVPPLAQTETRYGGIFFLINLALYLELYGDFAAPLAPCLPLPVWDFVALLGERLLGEELRDDAVWSLLAELAGRDARIEPGEDFVPADEWRVPVAWLESLPTTGAWSWSCARGRLRVKHPSGFLVLDLPRDDRRAARQLTSELQAYAGRYTDKPVRVWRGIRLDGRTPRERWFERLAAYVGARLRLALGQESAGAASRLLCALHARVAATATHVDVFMSLADLPVEVRLSGLDRDPGWLPAAGRFVAFHFD